MRSVSLRAGGRVGLAGLLFRLGVLLGGFLLRLLGRGLLLAHGVLLLLREQRRGRRGDRGGEEKGDQGGERFHGASHFFCCFSIAGASTPFFFGGAVFLADGFFAGSALASFLADLAARSGRFCARSGAGAAAIVAARRRVRIRFMPPCPCGW